MNTVNQGLLISFFATLLFHAAITPNRAHSQTLSPAQLEELPPEVARQLHGVTLNEIKSGRVMISETLPRSTEKDPDWVSPLPITLHLRGESGVPLPDPVALKKRRAEFHRNNRRSGQREAAAYQRLIHEQFPEMHRLKSLPECHRDKSEFREYPSPAGGGILRDVLFIAPGDVPLDIGESFGEKTVIVRYDPAKPSSWAHYAKLVNIQCLPSRIRILGNGVSRLEGLPALKNYDGAPYGKGVLSEAVKSRSRRLFSESGGEQ